MIRIRPSCLVPTAALLLVLLHTPAPAVTLDIGASTVGTPFFNQSFNETRAVDITVLSSDLMVVSMTLKEFNLVETSGTVGARIYDTATGTLIASADQPAGPGFDQSITIPISALLQNGKTYRVGFFISAGCCGGSGDFIDADPPGLTLSPYLDLTGSVQVTAAWAFPADVFATTPNGFVPLMAIDAEPMTIAHLLTRTVLTVGEFQPRIQWSGRVNAIAVHPTRTSEVIVATESGGLFKSVDGGRTWAHVDSLPVFHTNDVAYVPDNPDVLIATAGRPTGKDYAVVPVTVDSVTLQTSGDGIWISPDGGATWSRPAAAVPRASTVFATPGKCPEDYSAFGVSLEPGTNRIFVATDCGVSISEDDGESWTHVEIPYVRNLSDTSHNVFVAVAALGDGRAVLGGYSGVWWSEDGGSRWAQEETGIGRVNDVHAIGDSPRAGEVFLVNERTELYRSGNGGRAWERIDSAPGGGGNCGGIAFVKVFRAERRGFVRREGLDLYFGNRCEGYRLTTIRGTFGTSLSFDGPWTRFEARQHGDARDVWLQRIGIPSSGSGTFSEVTPVFLANDGGLEHSSDGGHVWTTVGSGPGGINALQVTEVSGQRIRATRTDLVFGTQDTDVWASDDGGVSWPASVCCEGFGIYLERAVADEAESRMTYVACFGCATWISGPLFAERADWPDPRVGFGYPVLVRRGTYVQQFIPDPAAGDIQPPQGIQLTQTFGGEWRQIADIPEEFRDVPKVAGPADNPTVYQAVRVGTNRERLYDAERLLDDIHLVRLTNILGDDPATKRYPAMNGFGSLGVMPTMFAWYWVYAVDPQDPMHLIAPDVVNGRMAESWDGGENWAELAALTRLVTKDGALAFVVKDPNFVQYFPLVSAISFHPQEPNLVLLGTRQGGAHFSRDRGRTWVAVAGSERMVNITSFHWTALNEAVVATYGRGLWKTSIRTESLLRRESFRPVIVGLCPACRWVRLHPEAQLIEIPLAQLPPGEELPFDTAVLAFDGGVLGARATKGALAEVTVSPSASYLFGGAESPPGQTGPPGVLEGVVVEIPGKASGAGTFEGLPGATALAQRANVVGITTLGGQVNGAIVADAEIPVPEPGPETAPQDTGAPQSEAAGKPYLVLSANNMTRGLPVLTSRERKLFVSGRGFDPGGPLEVEIDGIPQQNLAATVGPKGDFALVLELELQPGLHRIVVRQRLGAQGELADATSFLVQHEDEEKPERVKVPGPPIGK